jgi:hypothetical protein
MPDSWMGPFELLLVFGLVIGLAVRELVKLKRDAAAARQRETAAESRPESAPAPAPVPEP